MLPEAENKPKDLPEAVQDLRRDYQLVQEAVKHQQDRNYNHLQKLYTGGRTADLRSAISFCFLTIGWFQE